ncbi:mannonate dehydratase [uncultured Imperialibacter sp.]|uniref:mannonate dehydratase n=1 Tax=uncultured Imperialibacter sp. TaxID=1672639 RepID=UPI0030DA5AFA|tara:strand:- start:32398 stop:33567 length:1170 start_codon:yes stop_codon:yes gene_type:complete
MIKKPSTPHSSTSIDRRDFTKALTGGFIGAGLLSTVSTEATSAPKKAVPRKNNLHHVGGDYHVVMSDDSHDWNERQRVWTNNRNFQYHERQGVKHFTNIMSGAWNLDQMKKWKADCDNYGMTWEAIRMDSSYIYLKPGAEREKKVEEIAANIERASQVGVKVITMHWTLIPIRRNGHTPGRGGSSYHAFKLEDNWKSLPVEAHGIVSYDDYWERITYFLTNLIPVCEQYDVRLGIHPYDPPGLPRGYQGVDTWDAAPASVFESLKKYESIVDSPYNAFQLCLGTVMEGLKDPKNELLPIVKYFAEKGKIVQIHMRNIRGGLHNFEEVYIDEGEADFIEVVRILRDAGYQYSICPDHVPTHPDDPRGYQAFAQAFGYIRSLIAAANAEVA